MATSLAGDQVVVLTTGSGIVVNLANWALNTYVWPGTIPQPVEAALTAVIAAVMTYGAILAAYWQKRLQGTLPAAPPSAPAATKPPQ